MERMQEGFGEKNEIESSAIRVSTYEKRSSAHDSILSTVNIDDIDMGSSMQFSAAGADDDKANAIN